MKAFFTLFILSCSVLSSAQVINLDKIENAVYNADDGTYREVFKASGFELVETAKEGKNGVFEKWIRKDNNLYLTLQHNDSFHFTKLILSTAVDSSKPTIRNLLDEISKNYSRKTIDDQDYYINEEKPDTTVHLINLKKEDQTVEGILFFRKY